MVAGESEDVEAAEPPDLQELLGRITAERDEYRKLYLLLLEENEKLKRGLLGQKAERLGRDDRQLSLALIEMLLGKQAEAPKVEIERVREHERRKPTGRKPLPEHLPRIEIEVLPPEVIRRGLDDFERIGEEVSEALERRRASAVVVRTVRPKLVAKDRQRNAPTEVLIAEAPELPIPRGMAGPGMLADTVVRRWQDHQPLHRLERIYGRDGLDISRSTICGWHAELATLARPVVVAMRQDALRQPYLCTDATGVLVQAKEKCRTGHFWVLLAPELHVLFCYSRRHDGAAVDKLLDGYEGYLVADAHSVYDHLFKDGKVVEVGCFAHARRYFWKALGSEPDRAREALAMIGALFQIERTIEGVPRERREAIRNEQSRPIVERFFAWCDGLAGQVLEDTPLAKAIGYARNQRGALMRFLEDGRLPIHNNGSELQLRRQVVGRRNWIFCGSDDGAEVNTVFVSLLASCGLHQIEPWEYLRDIFCLLPSWPRSRALELAPAYWKKTLEDEDTQRKLVANPFR